jgi:hypothetical protein
VRPDWAPQWWGHTDRHHILCQALARIGRHETHQPGLLARALRREADYLDWSTCRDSTASPRDRVTYRLPLVVEGVPVTNGYLPWDEEHPGDWDLEDQHWGWLDAGGWGRKQFGLMARRFALVLEARRHQLRAIHPDGRPFEVAA